jgi:hypothetical protein
MRIDISFRGHHDGACHRYLLHAGRQVRRLTDRRVINVEVAPNRAHDHFARIEADADLYRKLPGLEVSGGQTELHDRIVRQQLGHFLELPDPITLRHDQLPWILPSGTSTRLTPLKLNRSSTA